MDYYAKTVETTPRNNYLIQEAKNLLERAEREATPMQSIEMQQAYRIGTLEADLHHANRREDELQQRIDNQARKLIEAEAEAKGWRERFDSEQERANRMTRSFNEIYAKHENLKASRKRTVKKK